MKKRILFVDDEPDLLEALRRMLRKQQAVWDMRFALSADEALEAIDKTPFDAVISDIKMPGKDGFDLLKTLRESAKTRDIPVVILTGQSEPGLKRRALDLGATDLLNKPANLEDLLARIHSVLRLKSYQDRLKAQSEILEQKVRERTLELEKSRRDIIWRLAKAGEHRDDLTGRHVARVGCYCRVMSEELGMGRDFVEMIFLTSPLHDIGKIGVPDEILLKKGKLSADERAVMERHCAMGAEILIEQPKGITPFLDWQGVDSPAEQPRSDNPLLKMASIIAMNHHERWDGAGYPNGLAGQSIPIEARIAALADVYDALSFARPYKSAYGEDETLTIIRREAGRHFDPEVFEAFQRVLGELRTIRAELSDETCAANGKDA